MIIMESAILASVATPGRWCGPMQPHPNEPVEEWPWHIDPHHLGYLMRRMATKKPPAHSPVYLDISINITKSFTRSYKC